MSPLVTFPLLVVCRALDWGSTALVTPTLKLEANTLVRKRPTRRGIIYELIFCAVCAFWTPTTVMVCIASTLLAATNMHLVGIERDYSPVHAYVQFMVWLVFAAAVLAFAKISEVPAIAAGIAIFALLRLMFAK